jgi:hypothetical protein
MNCIFEKSKSQTDMEVNAVSAISKECQITSLADVIEGISLVPNDCHQEFSHRNPSHDVAKAAL